MTSLTEREIIVEWLRRQYAELYPRWVASDAEQRAAGMEPFHLGYHPSAFADIAARIEWGEHLAR